MQLRLYFHQGTDLFIKLLLQVLIGTTYLLTPPDKVGPFDHFMHRKKRFSDAVDIYFIIQIFRIVKLKTCFILCKSSGDLLKMNKKKSNFFSFLNWSSCASSYVSSNRSKWAKSHLLHLFGFFTTVRFHMTPQMACMRGCIVTLLAFI